MFSKIENIQFSNDSLRDICFSLKILKSFEYGMLLTDNNERRPCLFGDSSTLAFLLRHVIHLEEFSQHCSHPQCHLKLDTTISLEKLKNCSGT